MSLEQPTVTAKINQDLRDTLDRYLHHQNDKRRGTWAKEIVHEGFAMAILRQSLKQFGYHETYLRLITPSPKWTGKGSEMLDARMEQLFSAPMSKPHTWTVLEELHLSERVRALINTVGPLEICHRFIKHSFLSDDFQHKPSEFESEEYTLGNLVDRR